MAGARPRRAPELAAWAHPRFDSPRNTKVLPAAGGHRQDLEGLTGIEPALSAWEAEVLPLNYSPAAANGYR